LATLESASLQTLKYLAQRLLFLLINIALGVSVVYAVLRVAPLGAVEIRLQQAVNVGIIRYPEDAERLRAAWLAFYGLEGDPLRHYYELWRRLATLDFGPSLISFPTPVSDLISRALPWTLALLTLSILFSWLAGTALGILLGSSPRGRLSQILETLSLMINPVPYYILSLILIFLFAYLLPLFPLGGGVSLVPPYMTGDPSHDLALILNMVHHASLPALSLILPSSLGLFFLNAHTLTRVKMLEEHVAFAGLLGLRARDVRRHLWGEIKLPQATLLSLQLGQVLGGALITEIVFAYPGLGYLLYRAVTVFDYNLLAAVALLSCIVVSMGAFLLDLLAPLLDPRVRLA